VKICSRCRGEQEASPSHAWGEWQYISDDSCSQAQVCERCAVAGGKKRTEHLWGEWQHSELHGGAVRVCRRCGELTVSKQAKKMARSAAASPQTAVSQSAPQSRPAADNESAAEASEMMFGALEPKMMGATANVQGRLTEQVREQSSSDGGNADPAPSLMEPADSIADQYEVERDERLIGHWRFTDAMSSGGGFSQATDYHRVLGTDGVFFDRSHTCGSFGESWSDPEYGRWRADHRTLYLEYNDGSERTYAYHLEDNKLFFPGARMQRLWERVG
jgi:hypothetical protein